MKKKKYVNVIVTHFIFSNRWLFYKISYENSSWILIEFCVCYDILVQYLFFLFFFFLFLKTNTFG